MAGDCERSAPAGSIQTGSLQRTRRHLRVAWLFPWRRGDGRSKVRSTALRAARSATDRPALALLRAATIGEPGSASLASVSGDYAVESDAPGQPTVGPLLLHWNREDRADTKSEPWSTVTVLSDISSDWAFGYYARFPLRRGARRQHREPHLPSARPDFSDGRVGARIPAEQDLFMATAVCPYPRRRAVDLHSRAGTTKDDVNLARGRLPNRMALHIQVDSRSTRLRSLTGIWFGGLIGLAPDHFGAPGSSRSKSRALSTRCSSRRLDPPPLTPEKGYPSDYRYSRRSSSG
jgi:hypothetical protein